MTIHPRDFLTEYVEPAIELYRINRTVTHLAVHAISQVDNLAEVVALWTLLQGRPMLGRGEATQFRAALGQREPVLAIMNDAHDSHKHGRLIRSVKNPDPKGASEGQRPETAVRHGFFLDHTFLDGPLTPYDVLVVRLNDGTEEEVFDLLYRAREAWDRELARLSL